MLTSRGIPHIVLLLSEIFPAKLALMEEVDAWVQVRVFFVILSIITEFFTYLCIICCLIADCMPATFC